MKKRLPAVFAVFAVFVSVVCLSLPVSPGAETSLSADGEDLEVGLTVIPARVVSSKNKVELRCGLVNNSPTKASGTLTVEFISNGTVAATKTVSVKAGGSASADHWWNAAGKKGCNVLGIRVRSSQGVIAEEYKIGRAHV